MKISAAQTGLLGVLLLTAFLALRLQHYQRQAHADIEFSMRMLMAIQTDEVNERLLAHVDKQAQLAFETVTSKNQILSQFFRDDLFVWKDKKLVPAYVPFFKTEKRDGNITGAFARGVKLLAEGQGEEARACFSRCVIDQPTSGQEAWIRVASCLNLLELEPNDRLRELQILSYLNGANQRFLTAAQIQIFREEFSRLVSDDQALSKRNDELWHFTLQLEEQLERVKGPYRARVGNRCCVVSVSGIVYVMPTDWVDTAPVEEGVKLLVDDSSQHQAQGEPGWALAPIKGYFFSSPKYDGSLDSIESIQKESRLIFVAVIVLLALLFLWTFYMMRKEKALASQKDVFVATASHELRTPISVIQLHAETLALDRVTGEKKKHYENAILGEAQRAGALVENFLSFSQQRAGKDKELAREPLDLSSLVASVVESFPERVSLREECPQQVEVKGDAHAIRQILFNLIDNALKYSEGEVVLDMKENGVVEVIDQGIGIAAEDREKVFDEFYRSADQRVSSKRGSGIGLTVSRRLARSLGGDLSLAENPSKGTIATLTLSAS